MENAKRIKSLIEIVENSIMAWVKFYEIENEPNLKVYQVYYKRNFYSKLKTVNILYNEIISDDKYKNIIDHSNILYEDKMEGINETALFLNNILENILIKEYSYNQTKLSEEKYDNKEFEDVLIRQYNEYLQRKSEKGDER